VGSEDHYKPLIVADDYECRRVRRPTAGRTSMVVWWCHLALTFEHKQT